MDPQKYYSNMVELQRDLAQVLGTRRNAKTVVFAVKMFGYAMRIATGEFRTYPMEIPIPVDSRIEKLTKRFGDVKPISFWNSVARSANVPPLHIDSILWPALSGDPEVVGKIVQSFGRLGEDLMGLLSL